MKNTFWAGTPESYTEFAAANTAIAAATDKQKEYTSPIYQLVGDVGVVKVSGTLVTGEVPDWAIQFGVLGYNNLEAALVEAVADKKAKSILLHVSSGGGAVNGLSSTAKFIQKVAAVKPTSAYAEYAASAAYWLASAAGNITLNETAIVGSIGVLMVHQEYSKAYEKEGITTTVLRVGEFKTLMNQHEPLTEVAIAQTKELMDYMYGMFKSAIADNRGTTPMIVDSVMGQGRVFIGPKAIEAGLVDSLGSFEDAVQFSKNNKTKRASSASKQVNNTNMAAAVTAQLAATLSMSDNADILSLTPSNMKNKLNEEQLAALAAGVSLEDLTGEKPEGLPTDPQASDAGVETEADEVTKLKASLETAQTELEAAQKDLELSKQELAKQAETFASAQETTKAMQDIVVASISQMNVALNRNTDLSAMTPAEVVTLFAETKETMTSTFKAGARAKSVASAAPEKAEPAQQSAEATLAEAKFLAQAASFKF